MNNEPPQAMSQRVGHYHTLNVLLFIAVEGKQMRLHVPECVEGLWPQLPSFYWKGSVFVLSLPLTNTFRYFAFKGAYGVFPLK